MTNAHTHRAGGLVVTVNGTTESIQTAIRSLADTLGADRIAHIALATDGTQALVTIAAQPRPITAHEADAAPLPDWWQAICQGPAHKKGQ